MEEHQPARNPAQEYPVSARVCTMDAAYLRERAAICLRLANGLSWNNPARSQLLDLAEDFNCRARNTEMAAPARCGDDQNRYE
jgi:hypothetical protein